MHGGSNGRMGWSWMAKEGEGKAGDNLHLTRVGSVRRAGTDTRRIDVSSREGMTRGKEWDGCMVGCMVGWRVVAIP